eukprot:snap_masked-scaffold_44-processed-gene-1.60-mRNA-1 protein AED:1.00 eAED:1.00 QI:0/-1/0/0/-1/1/1/0/99
MQSIGSAFSNSSHIGIDGTTLSDVLRLYPFEIQSNEQLTHNVHKITCKIPTEQKNLFLNKGIPSCAMIYSSEMKKIRAYDPVILPNTEKVEFMIKSYPE